MNTWLIIGIIVLVLGLIIGNVMLLKYSAKLPFKAADKTLQEKHKNKPE